MKYVQVTYNPFHAERIADGKYSIQPESKTFSVL